METPPGPEGLLAHRQWEPTDRAGESCGPEGWGGSAAFHSRVGSGWPAAVRKDEKQQGRGGKLLFLAVEEAWGPKAGSFLDVFWVLVKVVGEEVWGQRD